MSSGGKKTQTTTQTNDPPTWATPYFQQALGMAGGIAKQPYQAYTGNLVAGLTGDQQQAADMIRAQSGNTGLLDAGTGYVQNMLSGGNQFNAQRNQFAGENPYLDQMIANAHGDVVKQYQNATLPGLMSQFNAGGAYGGSAHQQAVNQANDTLASQLGQISTGLRSADYDRQVGLDESYLGRQQDAFGMNNQAQMGALGAVPGLNQAGYLGAQMLGQQGSIEQINNQAQLDSAYNQYLDKRDWSANQLGVLGNILGTVQGGSSSMTGANSNYRSAGQNAATAAALIAAMYGGGG